MKGYKQYNWKTSDLKRIKENIHLTDKAMGEHFGVPTSTVAGCRKRHGLMKGIESGRFKKGQEPTNKGQKMTAEKYRKCSRTMFKKGQTPANAFRKMFDVFAEKEHGRERLSIKLPHNRHYPYNRYVWEQKTGEKLTAGDVIRFKYGNPLNCEFSNLLKVTRQENIKMNSNRKKAAESLKKVWGSVKAFEDYGLTPVYKFRSKRA
jgi:hypothetical protein